MRKREGKGNKTQNGQRKIVLTALVYFMYSILCLPAFAQTGKNNLPLEVTASHTLEWHRDNQKYIARGDAVATQGATTIRADNITANYRETDTGTLDIYQLVASGNVHIDSEGNKGQGEQLEYDVAKGVAVMTGSNLRLTSPGQTVTARDRFEYWTEQGRFTATGDVIVIREQDRIDADTMTAWFRKDGKTGKRSLHRMRANGNVVIRTPTEILTGAQATYNAPTSIATLEGGVTIKRGPNILEGQRAEVNLATNVSRMFAGPSNNGRVTGTFYPGSNKSPTNGGRLTQGQ